MTRPQFSLPLLMRAQEVLALCFHDFSIQDEPWKGYWGRRLAHFFLSSIPRDKIIFRSVVNHTGGLYVHILFIT